MYNVAEIRRLKSPELAASMFNSQNGEIKYRGEPLPGGLDCALEVVGKEIAVFLGGEAASPDHPVVDVVSNYSRSILNAAKKLKSSDTSSVVFVGRWHDVEPDMDPLFIGFLIHIVNARADVVTKRYDVEIFDWDDSPNGSPIHLTLPPGASGDQLSRLRGIAESEVKLDEAFRASSGKHMVDGMLFYPVSAGNNAPVVVVKCIGSKALKNDELVKEGIGSFVEKLSGYNASLAALRVAANKPTSSESELNAGYLATAAFASELEETGYTVSRIKDIRHALAGTHWGIYRGVVVRRDADFGVLTFFDLYQLGLIDEFHSYFDGGDEEISKSTMTFEDSYASWMARVQVANPIAGADALTHGVRFSSGWLEWYENRKMLFEA